MKRARAISYYLSHPIQYFSPLLRELAKEVDLSVYYLSDASVRGNLDKGFGQSVKWDTPLLEGYAYTFVKNYSWRKSLTNRFADLFNPGVLGCLLRDKSPVIIVNGWSYFSVLIIILFAKSLGKEVWLRAENPLNQELRKSRIVIFAKRVVLQYGLFKIVDRFLYIGSESKKFFKFFGVKEAHLVFTPYAVDNDQFQKDYNGLRSDRTVIKQKLGLPGEGRIILFVGKYIAKKRPLDLLRAFLQLSQPGAWLVMVGEGELREQMEDYCKQEHLENVVFTGFVNQSWIAQYYSVGDVFVMCSGMGETWGLAVNEAMNFALPVIVTDTCGSSYDLVEHGVNGFVVGEGNVGQLKDALEKIIGDDAFRQEAGRRSLLKIREYSVENIVKHLKVALSE